MKNEHINEFDTLTLYVKKHKTEQIIESYKKLKWDFVEYKENQKYEDIIDLTFKRQHKINNKDDLQLIQVYLEDKLNNIGKLEKNKYAKSTVFGLSICLPSFLLAVLGALLLFKVFNFASTQVGIVLTSVFTPLIILESVLLYKIRRHELASFEKKSNTLQSELDTILQKASEITGGTDEES